MSRKVIITCAVTGAIHTPSMSKALPVTPQEIADAAIGAAEAGAAIVHLHARNPKTGQPDQSPEAFAPFLKIIKQRSNAVINLTTGGAPTMTVDERVRPAAVYKPEVASLNMGSMNFAFFGMLNRFKSFEHEWERKHLENKDIVFRNTFADIEYVLTTLSGSGTRFEFECYDTAHLYNLKYFLDQGLVKAPLFVQTVFGLQGGTGAHPEDVLHMKRTADRLFGDQYVWSVLGAGATSCRSRRWRRRWAATFGSGLRTRYGPRPAGWRSPTPSRSALRAKSSKVSALRLLRPTKRAKFSISRVEIPCRFEDRRCQSRSTRMPPRCSPPSARRAGRPMKR